MLPARHLVAILALPALAGCLGAAPSVGPPGADDAAGGGATLPALDVAIDPSDCNLGGLVLPTPFDRLAPHLPPGFEPRDAQAALGTPVPVGQGAVMIFHLDCPATLLGEGYRNGEFLIVVEPPAIEAGLEPSTLDLYAAGVAIAPSPLRDVLANATWPLLPGQASLEVAGAAPAPSAAASYEATSPEWSFEVTAPTPTSFANLERIWTATPGGLAFIENRYEVGGTLGVPACSFASGSLWAEILGRTSCGAADLGAVIPSASWSQRVITLPGVHAAAAGG